MKTSEMIPSKYLKQSDIPDPVIVTIRGLKQVNVAQDDQPEEIKWAIKFDEFEKPMILNSTNIHVAAKVLRAEDTDDWIGKEIVLYNDESVSYGGKTTGGLRFRGQDKVPIRAPARVPGEDREEDKIPW